MTPNTLGYVRVSTQEQASDNKSSIADQKKAIGELAFRLHRSLSDALIFSDPGVSGQTAEDRPGFMALVKYCEANKRTSRDPGLVLVLNDSRFGRFRDPDEAAYWRVILQKSGWRVRFAEGDDTEDMVGRSVLRAIGGATASAYSHAVRANAKRGARGAASRGLWQNEAPLGYRRLATRRGSTETRVLEPGQRKSDDEEVRLTLGPESEVAVVRWMFETYAYQNASLGDLARELVVRFPHRRWWRQTVRAVLTNPAYIGTVRWCRRPHDKLERKETPKRPASDWVVTEDAHPPIVSRDTFYRVRDRMASNARELRSTKGGYALTGLIRCAHCGEPYIGGGGVLGPDGDRDRYRFYKCRGGEQQIKVSCPGPMGTLMKRWIEPRVVDAVARALEDPKAVQAMSRAIDRVLTGPNASRGRERASLEKRRTDLTAQRDKVVAALARGVLTDADATTTLASIRAELAEVTSSLDRARFAERATMSQVDDRDRLLAMASDFRTVANYYLTRGNGMALREVLRPWIASAVVDKHMRKLSLAIRLTPEASPFIPLSSSPGPD